MTICSMQSCKCSITHSNQYCYNFFNEYVCSFCSQYTWRAAEMLGNVEIHNVQKYQNLIDKKYFLMIIRQIKR